MKKVIFGGLLFIGGAIMYSIGTYMHSFTYAKWR